MHWQTRDELEAAGELSEVTDPYVYEQHIDIDEDEENEDSLHKFYLKVRPWPKLASNIYMPGAKARFIFASCLTRVVPQTLKRGAPQLC